MAATRTVPNLRPSKHAHEAMQRRRVTWSTVVRTVEEATTVYPSNRHGRECSIFQRDGLAVVVSDSGVVVTVLLARSAEWTDADCRTRASVA